MKVCIDDVLTVECSHLLNAGETWNGWVSPVFTADQLTALKWEVVRVGLYDTDGFSTEHPDDPEFNFETECHELTSDEYTVGACSWVWSIAEDLKCEDCGRGIYTEGCGC